jgi:hypothetical protein
MSVKRAESVTLSRVGVYQGFPAAFSPRMKSSALFSLNSLRERRLNGYAEVLTFLL